jgi:hypothetical protein
MEWREGMSGGPCCRLFHVTHRGERAQLPGWPLFAAGFDVSKLVLLKLLVLFDQNQGKYPAQKKKDISC